MNVALYISAVVALVATFLVITRREPIHALLYLILSLLAIAVIFYLIGAPFVAALEVIIYAGAIMVLFVFVVMMLGGATRPADLDRQWLRPGALLGPAVLGIVLLLEFIYIMARGDGGRTAPPGISPSALGEALYGRYIVGVELTSLLLLAGLIAAYHLGRKGMQSASGEGDGHGTD